MLVNLLELLFCPMHGIITLAISGGGLEALRYWLHRRGVKQ